MLALAVDRCFRYRRESTDREAHEADIKSWSSYAQNPPKWL